MRYIDLFAGIGGFRLGLERANNHRELLQETEEAKRIQTGQPKSTEGQTRFTCVWGCEIDKYCRQIYAKNFGTLYYPYEWHLPPEETLAGDIRAVDPATIPDFDLLCAGFPCQSFSIAGKRQGFSDTRGTLFFDICRILQAKRPSYFLLENVKGLLSIDEGRAFEIILDSLDELGYNSEWQVLNSKNFGVPQNRERVFIVGHLRGKPRPEVFPIGEEPEQIYQEGKGKDIVGTIQTRNQSGQAQWDWSTTLIDANYYKGLDNHNQRSVILDLGSQGYRIYNSDDVAIAISNQSGGPRANTGLYLTQSKIRRLTPLECERLQGFPDGWTEGVSDTQRYKMLGNAVTVNVIGFLGKKILNSLMVNSGGIVCGK